MHKSRRSYRDGYKAHLAAEPETGLVTQAKLTPANAGDGPTGLQLLSDEPDALEVLADSAYGGGETRAALRAAGHLQTIKPLPLRSAVPGGFTKDDFRIDLDQQTVTCPAGHTVAITPSSQAVFGQRCSGCPLRERCTTAKDGKTLRCNPTKPSYWRHAGVPAPPSSSQATGSGGRWWNARSPGWSPAATGGCRTAAWPATSSGCRCGWPRSTCAGWSPWD
jgi:hypothetical protein